MAIVLLMAYGAHTFIVGGLNKQVDKLQQQVEMYVAQNVALQTAADMNESTIKNEALRIFNDHDITKLAKNKPGLMQPRANKATKSEFDALEELSTDTNEK